MRIASDHDDVLTETFPTFLEFYNREKGTNYTFEDITRYTFWEILGTQQEAYEMFDRFYETPEFKNLKLVPGAREGVLELVKDNDLIIVTSRPTRLRNRTESSLKENFGIALDTYYSNGFYNKGYADKADICKINAVPLIIEDCYEHAIKCAEKGIEVLLLEKPWNREAPLHEKITRVPHWDCIIPEVNMRKGR